MASDALAPTSSCAFKPSFAVAERSRSALLPTHGDAGAGVGFQVCIDVDGSLEVGVEASVDGSVKVGVAVGGTNVSTTGLLLVPSAASLTFVPRSRVVSRIVPTRKSPVLLRDVSALRAFPSRLLLAATSRPSPALVSGEHGTQLKP